ncbi:MAG: hypothetical protein PVI21_01730 [Candidatus Woesebacteria bacterium]
MNTIKNKLQQLRARYSDPKHKSFKVTKRDSSTIQIKKGVAEGWRLIIDSTKLIFANRKIFVWLMVLYALVSFFLVGGISLTDYNEIKDTSKDYIDGLDAVTTAMAYFGAVLSGGLSEAPSELQQMLSGLVALIFWLSTIWAARMILAGNKIKFRDAFYNGPTPLISTVLLLLVVAVQLIPAALGLFGVTVILTESWVLSTAEGALFMAGVALLCLLTLFWVIGSVVALVIVALPGMYPMQALVNARMLVAGNRWNIVTRLLAVAFIEFLVWAFIMIPVFMIDGWINVDWLPITVVCVQLLTGFSVVFTSVYVYKLYRSLI